MSSLGSIIFDVKARTAEFQRDLGRAQKKTQRTTRSMRDDFKRVAKSVFSLRSALVATAAATAMGAFIKKSLDTADAIAKASAQANIASGAYQELVFALDKFGIEQGTVNTGLQAFTKRVGEARAGTGALVTFLRKTDEAFLDVLTSAKSNEQALDLLIQRLGQTADDADRAALAAAAFSRTAGVKFASALKDGTEALDAWRKKARDLGIIIDEKLLKNAEDANDALSTLSTVIQVKLVNAVVELAPHIDQAADALVGMLDLIGDVFDNLKTAGLIPKTFEDLREESDETKKHIADLQDQVAHWEMVDPDYHFLDNLRDDLADAREKLQGLKREMGQGGFGASGSFGMGASGSFGDPKAKKPTVDTKKKKGEEPSLRFDYPLGAAAGIGTPSDPAENFSVLNGELEKTIDNLGRVRDAEAEVQQETAKMSEFQVQAMRNMENVTADFFEQALKGNLDSLEDFGDGFVDMIQRMTAEMLAFKAMEGLFGAGFGSSGGQIGGLVGSIFGGGKADGGAVSPNRSYIVGEEGPEMFTPGARGNITPNGGGRAPVSVTLNVQAQDAQSFIRSESQVAASAQKAMTIAARRNN